MSLGNRSFGLALAAIAGLLSALSWWKRGGVPVGPAAAAGVLLAIALLAPGILLPFNRLWTRIAHRIGVLSNYLLLGLFLYLFVLPMGLIIRAFGRDPMARRFLPEVGSYLTPVRRHNSAESLVDQF